MTRPLLALAACLLLGSLVPLSSPAAIPLILILTLGTLVLVFCRPGLRSAPVALAVCGVALGSAGREVESLSYGATPLRRWVASNGSEREPVLVQGRLVGDPDTSGGRWVLTVDVSRVRFRGHETTRPGRARIVVDGDAERPHLVAGQGVAVWTLLSLPHGFSNPGGFDSEAFARRRGIHVTGFTKSPLLIAPEPSAWTLRLALGRARDRARVGLMRHVHGQAQRALARALVLGDRTALDDDVEDAFRIAGTYHVLAISGAHVAVVVGLVLGLLRLMRCGRLTTAITTSLVVGAYAMFVGADPPVTRAAVMAATLLLGSAFGLGGEAANLLGLAALPLLACQPSAAADASFQLSFSATLGIILWTSPVAAALGRLPRLIALPVAASLAAQMSLAPLLVWHFHRLAPSALVLNLLALPLSSAVLVGGAVTALADMVLPPLARLLGWATTWAASGLLASSGLASWLPGAHLRLPDPSWLALACWIATLVAVAKRRIRRAVLWGCITVGALVAGHPPPGDGLLHLTALDVGDGDALVLRSPSGRTWVVDAPGGRPGGLNPGEAVVAPYLWHLGITEIDRIAISHDHRDHAGGVPALLQDFRVGSLLEAPSGASASAAAAQASSVKHRTLCRGERETWDGVDVQVLWPPCDLRQRPDGNEGSLILRLRYGALTLLLPGDAGSEVEGNLPQDPIDILKVAHHGRRTGNSDAFLARIRPRLAIVSVGRHGLKGPPDPHLVALARRLGTLLMRTDTLGAVSASTDGAVFWVRAYREGSVVRIRQRSGGRRRIVHTEARAGDGARPASWEGARH